MKKNLKTINEQFNIFLANNAKNTFDKNKNFDFGMPSKSLLDAGLKNKKIVLTSKKLNQKSTQIEHPFELHSLLDIVLNLHNPILVLKSNTIENTFLVLIKNEFKAKNFVVVLREKKHNIIEINSIVSLYPRNVSQVVYALNNNFAIWLDKNKALNWLHKQDLVNNELNHTKQIINNFNNFKNKTLQGTDTHEKQEETHEKIETKNNHIFSAKDLINKEYTSANVGIFSDILGNVTEPFYVMISGESGGGKSSFCMQLAKYFSDIKKKVLYITSEEGMSSTLKEKLKRFKITSETIDFTDNLESAKPILQNYNYVFFDSVNHMNINVADFKSLIKKGKEKNISMIFIFQYTKDGKFKGETEYAHEVDQTLVANQGVVSIYGSKNRFNGKGNFKVY